MDEEEEVAVVAIIVSAVILSKKICKKRKRRSAWVKPWLQRRSSHGFYTQLLNELRLEEGEIYENYLRMNAENFDHILSLVRAEITKSDINIFLCVSVFVYSFTARAC